MRSFARTATAAAVALLVLPPVVAPAHAQAPPSVFLEELTWTEVRAAIDAGHTTVIVPTAGTEQNGPHMVLGKHRYIVNHAAGMMAEELGDALVAPAMVYVPEGNVDPPSGHMRMAGTITLPNEFFMNTLEYAARSLASHGFTDIVFIGDSGGNQRGMESVAGTLNQEWAGSGVRVHFVGDYYAEHGFDEWLVSQGVPRDRIGSHAGVSDTSQLLYVAPEHIRGSELAPGGGFEGSGVNGDPTLATAEFGRMGVRLKVDAALRQIRQLRDGVEPPAPDAPPTADEVERARRQAEAEAAYQAEMAEPRPIEALNSVWIEELTWMEVRDEIRAGKTTAIVPTGGIEPNGPWVATGKHNYVLQSACDMLARELGNALCAPIVKLVPEGQIDPPTGHMRYPGTLSVRMETFEATLTDLANSLRAHGFTDVVFIGESGSNQRGQATVAARLNTAWSGGARVHHIGEFYNYDDVLAYMEGPLGFEQPVDDGLHDNFYITSIMMVTDPTVVRYDQRVAAGKTLINGLDIHPKERAIELGRKLLAFRVEATVAAIHASMAAGDP